MFLMVSFFWLCFVSEEFWIFLLYFKNTQVAISDNALHALIN